MGAGVGAGSGGGKSEGGGAGGAGVARVKTAMKSDIENLFEDFLRLMIERAIEARDRKNGIGIGLSRDGVYEQGMAQAYYAVVHTLINMAVTFGLDPDTFPELRFDCDRELLQ